MSKESLGPVVISKDCTLSKTGAEFASDMTLKSWTETGRELCKISGASLWWIGDWVNAGEQRFGEKYKVALRVSEFEESTLRSIASVCKRVELYRRRYKLSFWYHSEVAVLGSKEQDRFLRLAEEKEWTRSELRQAIRKENATEDEDGKPGAAMSFVLSKHVSDITRWLHVQLEDTPIDDMPAARREALARELQPIVDVYSSLKARHTPGKESITARNPHR